MTNTHAYEQITIDEAIMVQEYLNDPCMYCKNRACETGICNDADNTLPTELEETLRKNNLSESIMNNRR